jgi:hypothetical protein
MVNTLLSQPQASTQPHFHVVHNTRRHIKSIIKQHIYGAIMALIGVILIISGVPVASIPVFLVAGCLLQKHNILVNINKIN